MDLLQLMAQNGDLKSIIKETTTNKNYDLQTITIKTLGSVTVNQTIEPLLNYLNTSSYFDTYKKINSQNISNNIKTKEATILQIDAILDQFSVLMVIIPITKNWFIIMKI